jgi:chromosomal replication initiator protein
VTDDDLTLAWQRVRAQVRARVTDAAWHLWLEPLAARSLEADRLVVEVPEQSRGWVGDRFGRLLEACARAALDAPVELVLVRPGEELANHAAEAGSPGAPAAPSTPLHPRYTFDQFVIGDANRLAHAAALAVAEMPGLAYNPLYVCGPPGLGKTHLLHAIGNYIAAFGGGLTVRYTTAEDFTDHFLAALHHRSTDAFKAAHRGVDVLLVDDVQFLQARTRTEQEFFHTFNALHAAGAQLVLTSDRLPCDLDALEARLRERFEAGLVADVRPPDLATRLAYLRKRVLQDGVGDVEPEAIAAIADRAHANIRALEGAFTRVVAFASLTGAPVTAALASEVLDGLYPRPARRQTSVREIQEHAAAAFGVTLEDLLSASRAAGVAWPRQIAMYLARELTDESLPALGRAFGNRSHTTVVHACRRTAERMAQDPEAARAVQGLIEELRA